VNYFKQYKDVTLELEEMLEEGKTYDMEAVEHIYNGILEDLWERCLTDDQRKRLESWKEKRVS
jgi:hypothetical protein